MFPFWGTRNGNASGPSGLASFLRPGSKGIRGWRREEGLLSGEVFQRLTCKSLGASEGQNEAVVVPILQDRVGSAVLCPTGKPRCDERVGRVALS